MNNEDDLEIYLSIPDLFCIASHQPSTLWSGLWCTHRRPSVQASPLCIESFQDRKSEQNNCFKNEENAIFFRFSCWIEEV